jgi:CheY-specific phosphatase CheX
MAANKARELTAEEKLIRAFMMGVHTLFVDHLQDEVSVGSVDTDEFDASDVIGLITLDGAMVGEVRVRFPREVAKAIVGRYTGLADVPDAIFGDAVGELCNVIIGRAKSSIGGEYVKISPPTVEKGPANTKAAEGTKQVACETSLGRIWILFAARQAGRAAA